MKEMYTIIFFILPALLISQNLEVEGKVKISEMGKISNPDSVIVWLPDSTLGVQAISDLPFVSNQGSLGQYFYLDQDSDGYGLVTQPVWVPKNVVPPIMFADSLGDCNDLDSLISPGAPEICDDSLDNDCDGQIDEGCLLPDGSPCIGPEQCLSGICFLGLCGCNISGTWNLDTTIQDVCEDDFSSILISSSDCINIEISGVASNQTLTGTINNTDFQTTSIADAGLCTVTYSIFGTFTSQNTLQGIYQITYTEVLPEGCGIGCENLEVPFIATKSP